MDLIFSLFQAFSAAKEVAQVYGNVSDWVVEVVNKWSLSSSKDDPAVGYIASSYCTSLSV